MNTQMKKCIECQETKPLSEFGMMKGKYYRNKCKRCPNTKKEKACKECGVTKPMDEFRTRKCFIS